MAFAMGVFLGMSPLIGIHTLLAFLIAWVFRLNRFAALTGCFITNPWSTIPIYTFSIWVGALLLGMDKVIPSVDWGNMTVGTFMGELSHLLWPFVLGTTVVGTVSAVLGYIVLYRVLKRQAPGKG